MDYISQDMFYEMVSDRFDVDVEDEFAILSDLDIDYQEMQEFLYQSFEEGQIYESTIVSVRDTSSLYSIYSTVFK